VDFIGHFRDLCGAINSTERQLAGRMTVVSGGSSRRIADISTPIAPRKLLVSLAAVAEADMFDA
jgi:hypothetical protein